MLWAFSAAGGGSGALGGGDGEGDAAAGTEFACDLHPARLAGLHEVGEDAVYDLFVERVMAAEGIEVELQGLALDAELVRDVADADVAEVGLAGHGAEARELGTVEEYLVIACGIGVHEALEFGFVRGVGVFGVGPGKEGQCRMRDVGDGTFFGFSFGFGHFLMPFGR